MRRLALAASLVVGCTDPPKACPSDSLGDRLEVLVSSPTTFDLLVVHWGIGFPGGQDALPEPATSYTIVHWSGFQQDTPRMVVADAQLAGQAVAHGELDAIPGASVFSDQSCQYVEGVQLTLSAL